jgi:flagellum-specific peptidoglycan hydrolase FlgJ
MLTPAQLSALQTMATAAVAAERATGCPAELSTAQCIIESDWLTVCPGNNCFGIKATDTNCTYCLTKEYLNGKWSSPTLAFEAYPALSDCFAAHARLLQGGVYAAAWKAYRADMPGVSSAVADAAVLDAYITGISKHYATDPDYASKIITLAHGPHVGAAIAAARGQA